MTFQTNIPQPGDLISVSQDDILQNFQAIDAAWNINHEDFNAANQGKHKFVEMPNQTANPAGAASEFTIFSRFTTLPATGSLELWYKRATEGTAFQLTGTNPVRNATGYTFLPGNMLMQWRLVSSPSDGAAVVFPIAFSATPYSLQLTAQRNGTSAGDVNGTSLTATGFTLRLGSNSNTGVWVLAVGPA
jgi:hypothetical protein